MAKRAMSPQEIKCRSNQIKFFQKHIVEEKNLSKCSREMKVSREALYRYKSSVNFRQMALTYLDDSSLGGVKGTMGRLIKALDATRPLVTIDKDKDGAETTKITQVADQNTRIKALQEINKIYGLYAPQKKDVAVTVSISSDAELFAQIDEAERSSRYVDSYEEGEEGFELASDPQGPSSRGFESRKRALLQGNALPES